MVDKIRIVTTGGTIDKVYFDALSTYQVGDPTIVQILEEANVDIPFELDQICKKDSLELTDEDRDKIVEAVEKSKETRILITHGTDTMIETARRMRGVAGKTIVFTGSMAPARLRNSDAFFNVGCAIVALQTLPSGIYIVMNGRIHNPERVSKNRSQLRFEES